jgi:uncharacterized protein YutE (UPF0331/DUF86 family)
VSPQLQREAILARLDTIRHVVDRLQRHRTTPLDVYLADEDEQWIVERGLQRAAEAVLDICGHVAAGLGLRPVEDYTQGVDRLGEAGLLPADFVARFRGIGGFRNVLVHEYLDIDPRRVHEALGHGLDDLLTFAGHIAAYLEGKGPQPGDPR